MQRSSQVPGLVIREASIEDAGLILALIRELAEYERLAAEVVATEESLRRALFGSRAYAEVRIAEMEGKAAGFALFFHNFSTFLGRPGIYLEDLFVRPRWRGRGIGRALLVCVAKLAVARECGRVEWSVLDWNEPAIGFYRRLKAEAQDRWTVYRLAGAPLAELADKEI